MKRFLFTLTLALVALVGCKKETPEPEPIAVTSVSLDKTEVALIVGESANVKAIVKPDDAANKEVKWTVANTSIATVDEGEVTAVAVGETTLIVTTVDGGHTATIPVKVTAKAVKVSQIKLVGMPTEFTVGRSFTISAVITPDDATDKSVTFTSSNPEVATVEYTKSEYNYSLALLKAVGPGKATITVTANDGSGVKAEAEVDVLPAPKMVSDISITMSKSEVKVGYMVRATATVSPEDAENREVTWSSSNTAIARVRVVDGNNNAADVIGVSPGPVIITATAKDGSGVTASVPVTVIDDGESTYQSITITTSKAIGETIAMTVQGELAASEVEGAVIIDSKTYENGNTAYTFELTKQTVTIKQASIAYILFSSNQITSVDLNNSPDLKSLYCYMNAIKGENMTNLVKSLPDRTGKTAGKIIVYASNDSREKNVITKADVAIAKAKNWKVLDWNNNEYEGVTYQSITITTSKAIGETIVMTVQGELEAYEVEGAVIIDSKTYANGNTEYTFELTKQTVTIKQASIAYILFTSNQITSVDLNNSPDLKSLYCYMNAIKGENMTNLVKSLPDRTGKTAGKIIVYASNDSREKNVITKADVAIAKAKNWNVLDWDNKEYEGI